MPLFSRTARRSERATGLLPTALSIAMVIGFIGLSANVAIGLWVRATVNAVSSDAADRVAQSPPGSDLAAVAAAATEDARRLLGREGQRLELGWEQLGPEQVVLRVRHPGTSMAPRMLDGLRVGEVDRIVSVRREGFR